MMKKLNKLEIKPEKIMKNDELISLKGGTNCFCRNGSEICGITGTAGSADECDFMCDIQGCPDYTWIPY